MVLMALVLVLPATPAAAQAVPGDWSISLNGAGVSQSSFDSGGFAAGIEIGHRFTEALEISLRQGVGYASGDGDGSSTWALSTRLGGDAFINFQRVQPFLGASIGVDYGSGSTPTTWSFAPEAGCRFYVQQRAFLFARIAYDIPLSDGDNTWQYGIGIGLNLR
jgi:hypothetical protein